MIRLLLIVMIPITFLSCTRYSQIYQVSPSSPMKVENNYYTFENDTVRIVYSFWDEYGVMSFSFYNKLNVPIYIDWKKSSFIRNGEKLDYWADEVNTKNITKTKGYSIADYSGLFYGSFDLLTFNRSTASTNSKSIRPQRVIFIAPNSGIMNIKFKLNFINASSIDGTHATIKIPSTKKIVKTKYVEYSLTNSPLVFRNFISISLSEDFVREKYIDNGFYVDRIVELKKNNFLIQNPNYQSGEMRYKALLIDPKWFYLHLKP